MSHMQHDKHLKFGQFHIRVGQNKNIFSQKPNFQNSLILENRRSQDYPPLSGSAVIGWQKSQRYFVTFSFFLKAASWILLTGHPRENYDKRHPTLPSCSGMHIKQYNSQLNIQSIPNYFRLKTLSSETLSESLVLSSTTVAMLRSGT